MPTIIAEALAAFVTAIGYQPVSSLPQQAAATQAPEAVDPLADYLSFTEDKATQRMVVPVSVDGSGPFPFLVDTGAERTVISRELARRLALKRGDNVIMHSMTEVGEVDTARIQDLQVSKKSVNDLQAPALSAENLGAAGMLGVDSLQAQRVVFDFGKQKMSIVPSQKMESYWGPDAIVVEGRRLYGRLVLVDAKIDGQKITVILDTGSQVTIGNSALRRQLAAKKRLKPTFPIELVSVTGGKMTLDYTTTKFIKLGGIEIYDMPIGFADVHPFKQLHLTDRPALLLGMDVLRLFERVSVDFARKQVRFLASNSTTTWGEAAGFTRSYIKR